MSMEDPVTQGQLVYLVVAFCFSKLLEVAVDTWLLKRERDRADKRGEA